MTKTLTLMRHAKSGWDDPVARDFDRPLNRRGERAARLMGESARPLLRDVDRLVASPAMRVTQTLETFFDGLGRTIEAEWDRRVYLASAGTLLDIIRETDASVGHLMLAGHNPGLEDLVLDLVPDDGASSLRDEVETKFPTASIAQLVWEGSDWSQLAAGAARFETFLRPRDLDPALGPET